MKRTQAIELPEEEIAKQKRNGWRHSPRWKIARTPIVW